MDVLYLKNSYLFVIPGWFWYLWNVLSCTSHIWNFFAFLHHQQAQNVILSHSTSSPLFLYLPFQSVHRPVQAPEEYVDKYQFIRNKTRREYAAMVELVDEAIGNVTQAMQQAGWVSWLPGGNPLCMGYIGMCSPKGFGFSTIVVIKRVSILAILN